MDLSSENSPQMTLHCFPAYVILKMAAYLRAKQYLKYRPFGSLEGKRVLFGHFHHIK